MKFLIVGDIVGRPGLDRLKIELGKRKDIDFCIVNGENSASGRGLRRKEYDEIISYGADIITIQEFSEVLKKELPSLTRFENSNISIEDLKNMKRQELKIEEVKIIVPSLRLDNIISDLARTSRSKASEIISQERVFVNGQNETKNSKQIKLGDIITIRGKGRFVIKEFTGTTRSGRTVILIEKYV